MAARSASTADVAGPAAQNAAANSAGPAPTSTTVLPRQGVPLHQTDRVAGQQPVEDLGLGLLDREGPQQRDRPPHTRRSAEAMHGAAAERVTDGIAGSLATTSRVQRRTPGGCAG